MDADDVATGRSKRQKSDKHGRLAALDRLKQLKGSKNKYSVTEEAPVYELVDEREYSKLVQERQEDDWIIDDGTGYVEDGRELFDDDEDDKPTTQSKRSEKGKNLYKPPPSGKPTKAKDIKSMFMNVAAKKKTESNIKLDDDELLGNIMQNIHNDTSPITPKPTLLKKRTPITPSGSTSQPRRPINPFASTTPQSTKRNVRALDLQSVKEFDVKAPLPQNGVEQRKPKRKLLNDEIPMEDSKVHKPNKIIKTDTPESEKIEEVDSQPKPLTKLNDSTQNDVEIHDVDDSFFMDDNIDDDISGVEPEKLTESDHQSVTVKETGGKNFLAEPFKDSSNNNNFVTEWNDIVSNVTESSSSLVEVEVDTSKLPLSTNEKGEKVLRIFWLDAFEDNFKHPGIVYLFGKIWVESAQSHVSCCVMVKNIERRVFLLPREKRRYKDGSESSDPIIMSDVYDEFSDKIAETFNIKEFKCKPSKKMYAFEKAEVPTESEYLEVRYSAKYKPLPSDLQGETFSTVFGYNTSSLERFLIERKIKGPMWLEIQEPVLCSPPISWCKMEVSVDSMAKVSVMEDQPPKPNIVTMTLYLRTINNPTNHQNEIVAVASCVHSKFPLNKRVDNPYESVICALSKPTDRIFPFDLNEKVKNNKRMKIELINTERSLLIFLLAKIQKIDPDIIIGHDLVGFDLELLLHRLTVLNIPNWSRVGRLRRSVVPKRSGFMKGQLEKLLTSGRLICDIKISAQELLRCRSYDLVELISQVLHRSHVTIDPNDIKDMYSSSDKLLQLMEVTLMDSSYIMKIMAELNILPLALQITNIAGNLMGRTLLGGRSERNEFLLLHAFNAKNYICPDKTYGKQTAKDLDEDGLVGDHDRTKGPRRKKAAYAGGLVLEPKKGFYDHFILLMDFNSLYPSIIQEYNICFTTVKRYEVRQNDDDDLIAELPERGQALGILPHEIQKLVESRREVKKLMAAPNITPELKMQYDIRQKALKLTANSMYGCLGFSNSRFYAKPLAALITGKGRDILMQTKSLVENMGLDVIYGDTDSIMINTNSKNINEIMDLGNKIKKEVNKMYHLLEIEVDGLFKSMLLLKKKKYAALTVTKLPNGEIKTSKELKGLDIVRRDWSDIAKKAGEFAIDVILSNKSQDEICEAIHTHLEELGQKIDQSLITLNDYMITKQLTKNPEDYPDKKSLPHVQVALRVNSKGGKKIKQGDTVPYVICEDDTANSATQRAYHPDELKSKSSSLKIDTLYYKQQQILPVVSRLCEPIDGLDAASLASKLGLDPSSYIQSAKARIQQEETDHNEMYPVMNIEERFVNCDPLTLICPNTNCSKEVSVRETLILDEESKIITKHEFTILKCAHCETKFAEHVPALSVYLKSVLNSYIKKYYLFWMFCEDVACGYRTRKMPLIFTREGPTCPSCCKSTLRSEYSEHKLYHQLLFFSRILDIDKATRNIKNGEMGLLTAGQERVRNIYLYRKLKEVVDRELKHNRYGEVDLCNLFNGLYKSMKKP